MNKVQVNPNLKSVWAFRETLSANGLIEKLFIEFKGYLEGKKLIMNDSKMTDSSFTGAARLRRDSLRNKQK